MKAFRTLSEIPTRHIFTYLTFVPSLFFLFHFHFWPHIILTPVCSHSHYCLLHSHSHLLLHVTASNCKIKFLFFVFSLFQRTSQIGGCMLHAVPPHATACTTSFCSVKPCCGALTRNRCSRPIYNELWVSSFHLQEQSGTLGSLGSSAISSRLLLLLSLYLTLWTLNCSSTHTIAFLVVFWADAE